MHSMVLALGIRGHLEVDPAGCGLHLAASGPGRIGDDIGITVTPATAVVSATGICVHREGGQVRDCRVAALRAVVGGDDLPAPSAVGKACEVDLPDVVAFVASAKRLSLTARISDDERHRLHAAVDVRDLGGKGRTAADGSAFARGHIRDHRFHGVAPHRLASGRGAVGRGHGMPVGLQCAVGFAQVAEPTLVNDEIAGNCAVAPRLCPEFHDALCLGARAFLFALRWDRV